MTHKEPVYFTCMQSFCDLSTKYGKIGVNKKHKILLPDGYRYMQVKDGILCGWADDEEVPEIVFNFKKNRWQCRDGRRKML